jgi:hypothetical protein
LDSASNLLTGDNTAIVGDPVFAKQREQPIAHFRDSPVIYVNVGVKRVVSVNAYAIAIDCHFVGRVNN